MSSSPDEEVETAGNSMKSPQPHRRKVAIFLVYCGAGYQGMQKNPGAKTIESDLEEALFLSGAVPAADRGAPRRYDWARSARTDKGVSAAGQVVSGFFFVDPPGLVARLNSHLPPQIRILGFEQAAAKFNAKKCCDRRRYVYLLPVFALDPEAHPDRESVVASFGSGNELAKCLECSERGRKVAGLMGRQIKVFKEEERSQLGNGSCNGVSVAAERSELYNGGSRRGGTDGVSVVLGPESGGLDVSNSQISLGSLVISKDSGISQTQSNEHKRCEETVVKNNVPKPRKFRYGEKVKERFNSILKRYVGTHNFHNLTTRIRAEDPSAWRFIITFDADTVVNIDGIEFVRCEVLGQSFMLHQIRKMIGLAVAIMRNCAPVSLMDLALRQDININVPTAPEAGLYLEECFFSSYNQKVEDPCEELSLDAYKEQAEEFKVKHIYSHIASMEHKEGAVALWLHSLNHRNYPDFHLKEVTGERILAASMVV